MAISTLSNTNFIDLARAVIDTELAGIERLKFQLTENFTHACELLLACKGRVVVIGMGKSGHIASKIAATLASTGTPAFFVHAGEASHGDLGMITSHDVVIVLSYSGETEEIITLLPLLKRYHIPLISITGNASSTLATASDVHLNASVEKEACPLNLAPTASTTAALVLGDALAIALLEARGFTQQDFALSHPGGSLGRRLLLHIDNIMHKGKEIPVVHDTALLSDALIEMTSKRLGMTAIINHKEEFIGIFTDGDLRRAIEKSADFKATRITEMMTPDPISFSSGLLAAEVLQIIEEKRINGGFVIDRSKKIIGAFNLQDLLRAKVV